jgi:hypothetical protein
MVLMYAVCAILSSWSPSGAFHSPFRIQPNPNTRPRPRTLRWQKPVIDRSRQHLFVVLFDSETQVDVEVSGLTGQQHSKNSASDREDSSHRIAVNGDTDTRTKVSHFPTFNGVTHSNGPASVTSASPQHEEDHPRPTENGGYTHTNASRAKISAANKGKTPWNKGKSRSDETRAKIAAGVRARNRQRFLEKLEDLGVTEEQYEEQKREVKRDREAERRARRTENGGYRPTEATKQKISQILKEKYASGEVKPRTIDPTKVRKGFTHSDETRRKISESLKRRWADDEGYRENMMEKFNTANANSQVRDKISASLRKKWQDPEFRSEMLDKIANRRPTAGSTRDVTHRAKISAAMKAKWKDEEYRKKALESIAKRKEGMLAKRPSRSPKEKTPRKRSAHNPSAGIIVVDPSKPKTNSHTKSLRPTKGSRASTAATPNELKVQKKVAKKKTNVVPKRNNLPDATPAAKTKKMKADGNVDLLREERRDLYDLLYGDDESPIAGGKNFEIGDENLDSYDPYGLEDF